MSLHHRLQRLLFVAVHVLMWSVIMFLISPPPIGLGQLRMEYFAQADLGWFLLYGTLLNAIMVYSYAHLALPRYLRHPSRSYLILINLAYLLVFVLVESLLDHWYMHEIYRLKAYPKHPYPFLAWVEANLVITGGFMLAANLYGFAFGWFKSREQQQAMERAKLSAELQALKHQINPHFLFNVLNGLYGLAFKNEDEPTAEGIARLSQLMRYMLYDSNGNRVPLQREITYLEDYIALQRLRLSEHIEIKLTIHGQVSGKEIAPMILIPFVENAFKHGVSTIHTTQILIELALADQVLRFRVRNPVHPGSAPRHGDPAGGIGLQNVAQRLKIIYPKAHKLDILRVNGIYEVTLTIAL
jgi:hypothetical protein